MDADAKPDAMTARLDFAAWMEKMGYHGKQVTVAGEQIGMTGRATAQNTYRGERQLTETERLAMAAVRAGLPAWTPETDQEIADVKALREIVERLSRRS
jgi:hypothetical protein